MPTKPTTEVDPRSRKEWRAWLEQNHERESETWLILFKRHTGVSSLTYNDAIEEALCFGWIDGVRKSVDGSRYMHRLSPRKPDSRWSEVNKARAQRMIDAGLMKPAGLKAITGAKRNGRWSVPARRPITPPMPPDFEARLQRNRKAASFFASLAPSYQRQYVGWIAAAKREETRERRIGEALNLLAAREKLGMR
jgi:uncharacterized protein YdeI (YjbR/CyaY-like superfamily)